MEQAMVSKLKQLYSKELLFSNVFNKVNYRRLENCGLKLALTFQDH